MQTHNITKYISKLRPIYGILLFIGITLVIHYSFRYWAHKLHFAPVQELVSYTREWLADAAFMHTAAVLDILGYSFDGSSNTITWEDGSWLAINTGCSGFKQLLQAFFLFLLYPGRIRHKLWFIPLAIVLMHLANIIRLNGVALTLYYLPQWWEFSHDYVFRFVFYFLLLTKKGRM